MQQAAPPYECIHRRFEAQVARHPDAPALIYEDTTWSYAQLNERANQLAHYLQQRGVGPDVLVGICAERSPELVIGLLGILKAGGAYVPLDPLFPSERLQFMLDDTRVALLLTQQRLGHVLPVSDAMLVYLDSDEDAIAAAATHNPASDVTADHSAYVTYTSGSTGQPKGSVIPHRSIPGFMDGVTYVQLDESQIWLHYSSISWDALTLEVWPALLYGGQCVLYPAQIPTPHDLGRTIQAHSVNIVWLTVSLFNAIIDTDPTLLAGVRQLLVGGEALSVPHVRRALEALPATQIINGYGPSECTVFTCCYPVPRALPGNLTTIPIGRPIGDRKVYLLDAHLNRTPIGVPGELYIGGPAVVRCYLNRPALTAAAIMPDPFSRTPGARMYRTGDLVRYRHDGVMEFVGRIDHQVKVRGFRIEPEEIEAVLSQHAAVQTAVVIARDDAPGTGGPAHKRLVAYVVPQSQSAPTISDLRSFLQPKLPEYMIPSAFVLLNSLPLTPNGKIDRHALPAPEQLRPDLEQSFVAPRTPIEELLSSLWCDILGLDRIGVLDNFFELGGQSLMAARLAARVREVCQVELPIRTLFERPTIVELAEYIQHSYQALQGLQAPPLRTTARDVPLPLSFAQQRLWFLDQWEPNSALYNVPTALKLSGQLDVAALEHSLNRIVERHELLRTTFIRSSADDGQPAQIIAAEQTLPLLELDLRALPEADREAEARRLAIQEAQRPFDLATGPLIRATLLRIHDEEHVLLLTMHHIISDGWSMGVLINECVALYTARTSASDAAGQPELPPLPIQYADYAVWQRGWLQGDVLDRQLNYWTHQLADAPALLKLPTDRPRPQVQTHSGATHRFSLPPQLTDELAALNRREGTTLFMSLLAAFNVLLHWYSGQDDIVVGSPIAGRRQVELEPLIGCFVNTLVLRTNLAQQPTFGAVLRQVREVSLSAYTHQDIPFERLVEALQPDRSLGHLPLFQVWFVLQNQPMPALELQGLRLLPMEIDYGVARYDLRLGLVEGSDGLSGTFEYNSDLFDSATIADLATLFETLLAHVAQPHVELATLKVLLTEAHSQRQLIRQQALKETTLKKLQQTRRQSRRGV